VHVLDRRLSLPGVPAFHVPLPELPFDVSLTSVQPAPGGFVLRGVLEEWQRPLSRSDLDRLLAKLRGGQDQLED